MFLLKICVFFFSLYISKDKSSESQKFLAKMTFLGWGDVAQVVNCLRGKCKALSSNPSTTKRKKKDISSDLHRATGKNTQTVPHIHYFDL
jgi:hypothetical protein